VVDNGGIERFSCAIQYITDDVCACTILLPLKKMEWTMHSFYVTRRKKKEEEGGGIGFNAVHNVESRNVSCTR